MLQSCLELKDIVDLLFRQVRLILKGLLVRHRFVELCVQAIKDSLRLGELALFAPRDNARRQSSAEVIICFQVLLMWVAAYLLLTVDFGAAAASASFSGDEPRARRAPGQERERPPRSYDEAAGRVAYCE